MEEAEIVFPGSENVAIRRTSQSVVWRNKCGLVKQQESAFMSEICQHIHVAQLSRFQNSVICRRKCVSDGLMVATGRIEPA